MTRADKNRLAQLRQQHPTYPEDLLLAMLRDPRADKFSAPIGMRLVDPDRAGDRGLAGPNRPS